MKAAVIQRFGGPEVIEVVEMPTPPPGSGEILVKVLATQVNRLDLHVRQGTLTDNLPFPHILGMDAVGVVSELGPGVKRFSLGERVIVMPGYARDPEEQHIRPASTAPSYALAGIEASGTYAQYIVVPESAVLKDTSGLPPEQMAVLPLPLLAAIRAVQMVGEVHSGQRVLIHGAGSRTGIMNIQVAQALGAAVATTVNSERSARIAKDLGVECIIDTRDQDFAEVIRRWTDNAGVDVAIDNIGGGDFSRTLKSVKPHGIVVAVGCLGGADARFNLTDFIFDQKQIRGTMIADIEDLGVWLDRVRIGVIKPFVDTVLPLSEVSQAHSLVANNKARGGVVLLPWSH